MSRPFSLAVVVLAVLMGGGCRSSGLIVSGSGGATQTGNAGVGGGLGAAGPGATGSAGASPMPWKVPTDLALGGDHSCAIKHDGSLWCWGANSYGQLDDTLPTKVASLGDKVVAVSAYETTTCALKADGSAWCWGADACNGGAGDKTVMDVRLPNKVASLGAGVKELGAGAGFSCALKTDGSVWCWGDFSFGELGDGRDNHDYPQTPLNCACHWCDPVPSQVALEGAVSQISTGLGSCALKTDGSLWCWGEDIVGEYPEGTITGHELPIQVPSLGNTVAAVFVGWEGACAGTFDDALWCWGYIANSGSCAWPPMQMTDLEHDAVSATFGPVWGPRGPYGVKADGSLWWWPNIYAVPEQINALGNNVAAVAAGGGHTCARTKDGALWCWGRNDHGQLGDGTTQDSAVPVKVLGDWP